MERAISDEEKFRKAIEISQRRNKNRYMTDTYRVKVNNKKEYKLFKKMFLQILICLFIYLIFYTISSSNYIFSEQIVSNVSNILNYDVNFESLYNQCKEFIELKINEKQNKKNEGQENILNQVNGEKIEANINIENITEEPKTEENENIDDNNKQEEIKEDEEKTQMEKDAEEVKKICKFKKPLNGKVTSEFGEREVTSKVMSSDHKGIDIAAKIGTNINSAIDGIVVVAEQNSEYGKFIKITNGEVMTVYAHCNKLKVKKGDKIKQGQLIATVGTTGNSTGPHLHFEVRLSGRFINPRYVINF